MLDRLSLPHLRLRALLTLALLGCGGPGHPAPGETSDAVPLGDALETGEGALVDVTPPPPPFKAVTFNTGTSVAPPDGAENQGFQGQQHEWCDQYYGNGLSWKAFVEDARRFLAEVDPDVVAFQEIFWSGDCPGIPAEAWSGFVCEDWVAGAPTVAQQVLTGDWQVMCNPGKPDKCAAVNRRLGSFRGCDADFCLEGMAGATVDGCGKGARVGRGLIDLKAGGVLTLVTVHGSSGFAPADMDCRVKQVEQVFVDLGDGQPAANGTTNLVLGDFNTDPGRLVAADPSARRWNDFVGEGKPFHFVTPVGKEQDTHPTYGATLSIDHVVSDQLDGECWAAGVTPGHAPVTDSVGFDHRPVVCAVQAN
jgi:endonuclease/exonuclease/phosphatase family metal-dependent hydrolase